MAKFGYTNRKQLEPRPGKTYATEYYRQSSREKRRTIKHKIGRAHV